jgi:transposase
MHYIQGTSRAQTTLFPATLDEYIAEDNPVRFIDAFVDSLDLKALGFEHSVLSHTGRPPFHPSVLIKLYIYGTLYRLRSSRRLESECHRNVELMWLLQRLAPDFKTISDFRKDNLKALKRLCREFILLCKKLDLFGKELIVIDGSKFEAVNSNRRNYTKEQLRQLIQKIEGYIDEYFQTLDEGDESEKEDRRLSLEELQEQIDALKEHKQNYEQLLDYLEKSGAGQISLTDWDSRLMRDGHQGRDVCYNAQIAVDEKHHLIVADDVTNECNDLKQLAPMAKAAKEALEVEQLDATGDAGFYDSENVKACVEEGITPYVPRPKKSHNHKKGLYTKDDFKYDREKDCYYCPAGECLTFRFTYQRDHRLMRAYETSACSSCPLRSRCMDKEKGYRRITRWEHEHLLEQMEERLHHRPEMMKKRRCLVEHPFGSLKRWMECDYFLLRGLKKVRVEFSLMVLGYNLKRAINIVGVKRLIEAAA